jgi:tetratricopeptide (TPR) repeat protein
LALAAGREEAVEGMGILYAAGGRLAEKGELYKRVALRQREPATKARYLLEAAEVYTQAGDDEKAEVLLRQVAIVTPRDPRPYHHLATRIFAPRGAFALAKTVLSDGLQNGADPFALSLSLAECAQQAGDQGEVKEALLQALRFQPSSFDTYMRLSLLYIQEKNFGRAVLSLRKALEINPNAAVAFYHLGIAEEGRYQFFAAEKAYAQAVKLDPENTSFQQRYNAFLQKATNESE